MFHSNSFSYKFQKLIIEAQQNDKLNTTLELLLKNCRENIRPYLMEAAIKEGVLLPLIKCAEKISIELTETIKQALPDLLDKFKPQPTIHSYVSYYARMVDYYDSCLFLDDTKAVLIIHNSLIYACHNHYDDDMTGSAMIQALIYSFCREKKHVFFSAFEALPFQIRHDLLYGAWASVAETYPDQLYGTLRDKYLLQLKTEAKEKGLSITSRPSGLNFNDARKVIDSNVAEVVSESKEAPEEASRGLGYN